MDLRETQELAAFRQQVRRWLEENLPEGWGTPAYRAPETVEEQVEFGKRWQRRLYDGGWAGLHWRVR